MGEQFFPDGLVRTISLIGRKNVAQACQTAPVERLVPLGNNGAASPAWPVTKDVCVQVAGGIDAEDEPLMEQQVLLLVDMQNNRKKRVDGVGSARNAGDIFAQGFYSLVPYVRSAYCGF